MARPRPPRDRETAPGDEPGAESFAQSVAASGIVRLSDLFAPEDFESAAGPGTVARRATRKPVAAAKRKPSPSSSQFQEDARLGAPTPRDEARDANGDDSFRTQAPAVFDASAPGGEADGELAPPDISGPAYESLFGPDADAPKPRRRERKPATALQRAVGLLTRREHSRKELTRKLVSRGVDADEVAAAVAKLTNAGWQDDRRFADSLVRSRASSGYGPLHIRSELGTHDLPAEVREAALDEFGGDWVEIAREQVERRFGRIDDPRLRERKAADYLMRRGFPTDVVRSATRFPSGD